MLIFTSLRYYVLHSTQTGEKRIKRAFHHYQMGVLHACDYLRGIGVAVDGQIFYIDEDAYLMLQDYLLQLKATFRGPEGEEIVADIESRIREHFDERIAAGSSFQ